MDVSLESVIQIVNGFVTRTRGKLTRPIVADTKLFQEGLLDSFGLVELVLDLEKVSGTTIPEGHLLPDDFETPRVLHGRLQELP
jgi:acyl carrier protein